MVFSNFLMQYLAPNLKLPFGYSKQNSSHTKVWWLCQIDCKCITRHLYMCIFFGCSFIISCDVIKVCWTSTTIHESNISLDDMLCKIWGRIMELTNVSLHPELKINLRMCTSFTHGLFTLPWSKHRSLPKRHIQIYASDRVYILRCLVLMRCFLPCINLWTYRLFVFNAALQAISFIT